MAKTDLDLPRLCQAMRRARLALRFYREERREAVRAFAGPHWSEETGGRKRPLNLLSAYVSIVGKQLIAKNPRVLLSTFDRGMKPAVSVMQAWSNREVEHMRLAATLQRVVTDALFSVGICKVALATPADASLFSWNLRAGSAFAERVDLDDFVFDLHARDFSECGFLGHRYRVPLDVVKDSRIYSKARKKLEPSRAQPYNLEGDERIEMLGRGYYGIDAEEFEDFVTLWEVYLPRHRLVLTLAGDNFADADDGQEAEPLREQRWLGPDSGPYHLLGYGVVPGSAMPKGPIQDLLDLDDAVNVIFRKLIAQAQRQKSLLGVMAGATEDGSRIMHANDGDIIRLDQPDKSVPLSFGGPANENYGLAIKLEELFSKMAGNLDMMGGLSPQSKTATQDELLAQNASKSLADMQDRTITFTADVIKALCWYWYMDPQKVMRVTHSLPGLPDLSVQRELGPLDRMKGKFEDLDIRVDPYSLRHQTPEGRLQALNQVLTQICVPLMPLLVQQGISLDLNAVLKKQGDYLDMPDLQELLTIQEPPQPQAGRQGGPTAPGMPAQTERKYVRENRSEQTPQGQTRNLVPQLLTGNSQGGRNGQPQGAGV